MLNNLAIIKQNYDEIVKQFNELYDYSKQLIELNKKYAEEITRLNKLVLELQSKVDK